MNIQTQYTGNILAQLSKATQTQQTSMPAKIQGEPTQDVFVPAEKPAELVPEENQELVATEEAAEVEQTQSAETEEKAEEPEEQTQANIQQEPPKKESFLDKIKSGLKKIFGVFKKKDKPKDPEITEQQDTKMKNESDITGQQEMQQTPPLHVMHSSGAGTN